MSSILLVEDNLDLFLQLQEAFTHLQVSSTLHHFARVTAAQEFLTSLNQRGVSLPLLVMLNRDLPDNGSMLLLRMIKQSKQLRAIPVIIFSQSSAPERAASFYQNGANSYLVLPSTAPALLETMRLFREYWLRWSVLPTNP